MELGAVRSLVISREILPWIIQVIQLFVSPKLSRIKNIGASGGGILNFGNRVGICVETISVIPSHRNRYAGRQVCECM